MEQLVGVPLPVAQQQEARLREAEPWVEQLVEVQQREEQQPARQGELLRG